MYLRLQNHCEKHLPVCSFMSHEIRFLYKRVSAWCKGTFERPNVSMKMQVSREAVSLVEPLAADTAFPLLFRLPLFEMRLSNPAEIIDVAFLR